MQAEDFTVKEGFHLNRDYLFQDLANERKIEQ